MALLEPPFDLWSKIYENTTTTSTEWIVVGCKCGCENEEECHGENVCDEDKHNE